jgi:hypothetical protein
MGKKKNTWQDVAHVLKLFSDSWLTARSRYKAFVAEGVLLGKRPDLTGGGLLRSSGGWSVIKLLRQANIHYKSDERILGDSDFVDSVLKKANESLDRRSELHRKGYSLINVADKVAKIFSIDTKELFKPGKQPVKVKARSLLCFWATQELGISMTELAKKLRISQPAVSICTRRGERIAQDNGYSLVDE